MRTIKFRAWNNSDSRMLTLGRENDNKLTDAILFDATKMKSGEIKNYWFAGTSDYDWRIDGACSLNNNDTLMQYTCCNDDNNIEIFEGDILEKEGYWSIRIEYYKGMKVLDLDSVRYNNKITNVHVEDFDFTGWKVYGVDFLEETYEFNRKELTNALWEAVKFIMEFVVDWSED